MDLSVFQRINPCGYQGMAVTDIRRENNAVLPSQNELTSLLSVELANSLGYIHCREVSEHCLPDTSGVL
jgi:lipoyl(octanoyl) transferase